MPIKRSMDEREKILNLVQETEREETNIPFKSAPKKRSGGFLKTLGILVIIILVVFAILYGVSKYTKIDILKLGTQAGKKWQAVFLSNGQVYFGHVAKQNKDEVVLRDIYYLQVNQAIQPKEETQTQTQPELSLVKLGNELHGPIDEMRINHLHVLFIEDLKEDSRVVTAIKDYIGKQK